MCSRWWACSGSVHAFVGLVILPALALSPVALGVSGTAQRHWRGLWYSSPLGFLVLSVEFCAGCSAPLARTSQVGFVALSPGETLTRLLTLAHRCGDCWWCHDEAHCAQHHRPWGVEFRRPRQTAVPFGVLSCRRALSPGARILCSACFQHVRMRLPVLGSHFFCIFSQSTHWMC